MVKKPKSSPRKKPAKRHAAKSKSRPQPRRRGKKTGPRKSALFRLIKWGAAGALLAALGLGLFLGILSLGLPDVENLPPPGEENRVEVRDLNGELLAVHGAFYGERLHYLEIPPLMIHAIIAIEDRRFFDHGAVDLRGVLRAMWVNLWNLEVRQGASTITQQLAKNLFLTPERTFIRKARELLLARDLEASYTKEEIVALYLNRVYFGSGAYGIDAASERYFGHTARRLSLAEAALLAGLVKAPSRYTPLRSRELAQNRAGVVLEAMAEAGFINVTALNRARGNPAPVRPAASGPDIRYFTDWIEDQIADFAGPGRPGPFTVYTTLDKDIQGKAEAALVKTLAEASEAREIGNGAVVVLAPDGSVRAMVGGRSYQTSQFNRVTQARRQPGSAFKPVVYLAALERGIRPEDTFTDSPITIDGWSPANFEEDTYLGEVTVREAFALSLNTVAVRVTEAVGRQKVIDTAHRLGVEAAIDPHPSLGLGVHLMTPLELTALFATLANGGRPVRPYAILEIRGRGGELIYRRGPTEVAPVIRKRHLKPLTEMMIYTGQAGTAKRARFSRPFAAKTGTSQDFRDAWFIGFSAHYVTGVWVGNDDDKPMRGVSGGTVPAAIWSAVMRPIHTGLPHRELPGLEEEKSFFKRLFDDD